MGKLSSSGISSEATDEGRAKGDSHGLLSQLASFVKTDTKDCFIYLFIILKFCKKGEKEASTFL